MSDNNFPKITISQFKKIIKQQFDEKNFRPIFGLGKGGIGKTESIMELAKELNVGYIDIRLLLYNETDLKGIPYPDKDHIKTIWLQNNILPTEEKDGNTGILVFDEITSCARSVRTAAYQLLNERRLGEYTLPDGWMVVCLGNGPDDGGDFNGMEGNFLNRCSVYEVLGSVNTWVEWAIDKGLNGLVTGYIRFKEDDMHTYNMDNELNLFASPRSWKAVSDILNINENTDDDIVKLRILGNLGTEVGQRFLAFTKFRTKAISSDDILKGKGTYDFETKESIVITLNNLVRAVTEHMKQIQQTGTVTNENLIAIANAFNWLFNLNCPGKKEYILMTFKDIVEPFDTITYKLVMSQQFRQMCPSFQTFVAEYKNIVA